MKKILFIAIIWSVLFVPLLTCATEYVNTSFPPATLIKGMLATELAYHVSPTQILYAGKTQDFVQKNVYSTYVAVTGSQYSGTFIITVIKTDADYWFYSFNNPYSGTVSVGLVQTAY